MKHLGGIILAGGKSSRMGKDKAFIFFKNKMLIKYSIDLAQTFCGSILISANSGVYSQFGYQVVKDEVMGCGPIGGIYSTLKQSESNWNLVVSCDMPLVSQELVDQLISNTRDYDCIIPLYDRFIEPLVGLYHKSCLGKMESLVQQGIYKMNYLIDQLNCNKVDVTGLLAKNPDLFLNVNTPGDIKS